MKLRRQGTPENFDMLFETLMLRHDIKIVGLVDYALGPSSRSQTLLRSHTASHAGVQLYVKDHNRASRINQISHVVQLGVKEARDIFETSL